MRIIGISFSKISIEKFNENFKDVRVNTKIDISDIKEIKSDFLRTKEGLLGVMFTYNVNYEPDLAKIEVKGNIIVSVEPKMAKDTLKQWKNKKMSEDFRIPLFNVILKKSSLKTLQLEDEMNLPLHLPLPSFKREEKTK